MNYQSNGPFGNPEFESVAEQLTSDADLLRTTPVQNRLVLFVLFALEQRRLLEADRADTIDYLHELAQQGGLYWDFGLDAVQLELSRVFGGN